MRTIFVLTISLLNRLISGSVAVYKSGNAVKLTDAKNNHTYVEFDARGRRIKTIDRLSGSTIFTYTALGQLATLKDAENQTTSYTYSTRGEKLTETYPDHSGGSTPGQPGYGIVTFVHDDAGRVLRKQDQLGDTCTFNYDFASRLTSRDYRTAGNSPSSTIADSDTFTYDRADRMLTAVNGRYSNTVTYTYDLVGRKATESLTIGGQTYPITSEYNSRNELTKVTYPDSSISERTYHATGALNQLKLDGSTISTRTYDDGRRLTSETLGNGVTESRTYYSDNLLDTISYGGTGTAIGNLSYTWDENKNKKSETIGGVMSGYGFTSVGTTYDNEDRLTGFARASGTFTQSWNLTAVGDWTSVTTNGTPQARTYGPTHELLTAGGQNVTTDVKGNITLLPTSLTTSGVAAAYAYDFDNKLKTADVDNDTTVDVNFLYDALGRRVGRQGASGSFVFVQHDQQTIADYPYGGTPATPTYRYVYASYIDEPVVRKDAGGGGTIYYYHRTQQYSINAVTTSAGAVTERYAYTAYGQPTILNASATPIASSAIGNRYVYTGREWDATLGLYHFRARWMSGLAGRFMGRDPIGYVDGMSLYRGYFVPKSVDPLGLHDPIYDPFRDKIRAKLNEFRGLSSCLLKETGLGDFIDKLDDALNQATFNLHTAHILGLGGAASAQGRTIYLGSTDVTSVDVMILIHELVHVHDFIERINLGGSLTRMPGRRDRLFYAENMAYASEYFFNKFEQLSRLERVLAEQTDPDCDLQQREFEGASRIGPGYDIWVRGTAHNSRMPDVVIASEQMGLNFSCEVLRKCIKPHPCCELTCSSSDLYSSLMPPVD